MLNIQQDSKEISDWAIQYVTDRDKLARVYPMAEEILPTMWPWPDWKALDKWEFPEIEEKYGPELTYNPPPRSLE